MTKLLFSKKILPSIIELPRFVKISIVILLDALICIFTTWFALSLRLGEFYDQYEITALGSILSIIFAVSTFWLTGLYQTVFRYADFSTVKAVSSSSLLYGFIFSTVIFFGAFEGIPRSTGIIQSGFFLLSTVTLRIVIKYLIYIFRGDSSQNIIRPNILVYGAGQAAQQFIAAQSNRMSVRILGLIDDDSKLQGQTISGYKIFKPESLPQLIVEFGITHVLLAMPSISQVQRNKILDQLSHYSVNVITLPTLKDIMTSSKSASQIEDLDVNDVVGREVIEPNIELMKGIIEGKVVLVTGAGGSIGSELCRQIIVQKPDKILILDSSEFALYSINLELERLSLAYSFNTESIIPLLGSVQDTELIRRIIQTWKPRIIYHAAAYKHVPIVENNVVEGIKNNIFGTLNVVKLAIQYKVSNFILVSTDKAVRPTNIMGATKRVSEIILQSLHAEGAGETSLSMVRFGNVLASSGSVIPRFREQIKNGGPVTITHEKITRFFMTIPEAAQLVIQASAIAKGGDVFILDMGEPVKIIDLAKRMITLSGRTLRSHSKSNGDIELIVTGLRPGEKLHEELFLSSNIKRSQHPKIMYSNEEFLDWAELDAKLQTLKKKLEQNDTAEINLSLTQIVPEFSPWQTSDLIQKAREKKNDDRIN